MKKLNQKRMKDLADQHEELKMHTEMSRAVQKDLTRLVSKLQEEMLIQAKSEDEKGEYSNFMYLETLTELKDLLHTSLSHTEITLDNMDVTLYEMKSPPVERVIQ